MESYDSVQSQINLTHIVTSYILKIPFFCNLPYENPACKILGRQILQWKYRFETYTNFAFTFTGGHTGVGTGIMVLATHFLQKKKQQTGSFTGNTGLASTSPLSFTKFLTTWLKSRNL